MALTILLSALLAACAIAASCVLIFALIVAGVRGVRRILGREARDDGGDCLTYGDVPHVPFGATDLRLRESNHGSEF